MEKHIKIFGAREHNLKNIDVKIPRNSLTTITGLSGSGKSSLAFKTIYAEGQRRYIETFSAYARQYLGELERPDVDKILGLSPVIAIEQKTTSKNPRSTVGTITEIYDFLRLLYAKVSTAFSYVTNLPMVQFNIDEINKSILENYLHNKIIILSPKIRSRKGHYRELFIDLARKGFLKARVDGEIIEISKGLKLDRYKNHDIEVLIDELNVSLKNVNRLYRSIETALHNGNGMLSILNKDTNDIRYYSKNLMCSNSGISYPSPEPNTFSFNSPKGACEKCAGLGKTYSADITKIITNDELSILEGAIAPLGKMKNSWIINQIENIGIKFKFKLSTPIKDISHLAIEALLYGVKEKLTINSKELGISRDYIIDFKGIASFIEDQFHKKTTKTLYRWAKSFMKENICDQCNGYRVKKESLCFRINDKNIGELSSMYINELEDWIKELPDKLTAKQYKIGKEVLKEIESRIGFINNVGLHYLTLNRSTKSLSGGESQRIRLATQIGSELTNVLYILDEPSIGLHQKDNKRLIQSLKKLKKIGNSIIVVEHDQEMIESSDYIIDIGPRAGRFGGEIVAYGTLKNILESKTLTAQYLLGDKKIEIPKNRRKGIGSSIFLKGANGNNLKDLNVEFPLGTLICISGVSGSGKSTLVNKTLYRILNKSIYKGVDEPYFYKSIEGVRFVDKVVNINQSPIGRTPRSNPATYSKVYLEIRKLFAELPESKIRGYKIGRFSFNVKGGRCETCLGGGMRIIEMNFLPDVLVPCETCQGKRFNRETLEIKYKGKSIDDVLNMNIEYALNFFDAVPKIKRILNTLNEVGLGYVTLGQASTTLSGGEAQRVKLASELAKISTGNTFYILDEPTTGLHFEDIRILMNVLNKLVDLKNTVLIIEHNLDVLKLADYIIDLGPDGGNDGGKVVACGTPEYICDNYNTHTVYFLKNELTRK